MVLQALVFVVRHALTNHYVDEWEFMPALYGEEPALPWLWKLHNEHRFPLPRIVYLAMFWLTGDLRTGCYVSLAGMSALALGLMELSRRVRGRASLADAVFPLLLLQAGADENWYMGYQICFMLALVLACGQLAAMIGVTRENQFQRGVWVGLLGIASLMCGAAGVAYGAMALFWVGWQGISGDLSRPRRAVLVGFALVAPVYVALYRQGYRRPAHHPASAGVYESIRVGLEAQSMALGPAATGVWPVIGIVLLALGVATFVWIIHNAWIDRERRPAWTGLLAMLAGSAGLDFGIGWGRSGFEDEMGFAWRYGWITLPGLVTMWFACLMNPAQKFVARMPALLAFGVLLMTPFNIASGFRDAEKLLRPTQLQWEKSVREGVPDREIIRRMYPDISIEIREHMLRSMRLMRKNRYTYYEFLNESEPS